MFKQNSENPVECLEDNRLEVDSFQTLTMSSGLSSSETVGPTNPESKTLRFPANGLRVNKKTSEGILRLEFIFQAECL